MEVDASGLVRAREKAKREYQEREGISLSYVPFVIKATVEALKQPPDVQRPLDRRGRPRQAAHQHGRRGRGRRRAHRPGRPRRRPALDQRAQPGHRRRRRAGPGRQAASRRLRRQHVHHRQHRLVRVQPHDADHQRARGRDPDHGGDHQAAGRPRDPRGRRDRDPPGHEHGPRHRPSRQRRRPGGRLPSGRSRPRSKPWDPTRRSTDPMRVVVTGAAGFIGRAIVRQLAARGDHVVALVRDPATRHAHRGADRRAGRERPLRRRLPDRAHAWRRRAHPRRRLVSGRHPGVGAAGDARRERGHDRTRARCRDRRGRAADRLPLDDQHLRQHAREGRRRDVPARPEGRLRELLRRDEVARPGRGRGRIADGAPIIIVQPGVTYGPGDHSSVGQQLHQAYLGTRGVHRPRQPWHQPGPRRRPGGRDPRGPRSRHAGPDLCARRPERPAQGGYGDRGAGGRPWSAAAERSRTGSCGSGHGWARTSVACSGCRPTCARS